MKRVTLFTMAIILLAFALVACKGDKNNQKIGSQYVDETIYIISDALKECDEDTLNALMSKYAETVYYEFEPEDRPTPRLAFEMAVNLRKRADGNKVKFEINQINQETMYSNYWVSRIFREEVEVIINDKNLKFDTNDIVLCEINSYSNGEQIDDGILILGQEEGIWKIILLYPFI